MKGTLKLEDGRELTVDIDENTLKSIESPKQTGYNREHGKIYYYDDGYDIGFHTDLGTRADERFYDKANYYSDKTVAENNVRADTLMRKLRRFAVEHNNKDIDWYNVNQLKYEIYYYHKDRKLNVSNFQHCQNLSGIYFDNEETAKLAIEEFKDEIIWYFTEYKDSL